MKKILISVVAFFAMTAVAFAANTANINVTSEPIPYHAECDKAGGLTFSFDDGTVFEAGDQITGDLPLNVSICKSFDYIIGVFNDGADPDPIGEITPLPPIGTDDQGPITGDGSLTVAGDGIYFHVTGVVGEQRVTINIVGADGASLTFVGDEADVSKLALEILDQEAHGTDGATGMFSDYDDDDAFYDDATTSNENTLCINTQEYDGEYIKLSFDSKEDKFTWIPSDPQVAHVVSARGYALASCAKMAKGRIYNATATAAGQHSTDYICTLIDNEADTYRSNFLDPEESNADYAYTSDGFCNATHRNNRLIIQSSNGAFASANYQVKLEILVNGEDGDQGVYFTEDIKAKGYATATAACSDNNIETLTSEKLEGPTTVAVAFATDEDCKIAEVNKVVSILSQNFSTVVLDGVDDDFLYIDIPDMSWDDSMLTDGEELSVRVTLLKAPCGELFTGEFTIGTMGCADVNDDYSYEYSRVFPYFAKDGSYINVLILTNTASTAMDYELEIFEKDGDKYTATLSVDANGMAVQLLNGLTVTADDGNAAGNVFGDTQCYVIVTGTASFHGAAFVTNATTGESYSGVPSDIAKSGPVTGP